MSLPPEGIAAAAGPPRRGGETAADGPIEVRLVVDLGQGSLGAFVSVPMSLRSLIERLPPEAQPVLGWLPDIVLEGMGIRFDPHPATESFGVYAAAGITGSAAGSADAVVVTLPGKPRGVVLVAGLRLSSTVDLAGTPLFGSMLSGLAIQDLQVIFASADVPAGKIVLPPPASDRPSPAYTKGLQLAFVIVAGDAEEQFVLTPSQSRRPRSREQPGGTAVRVPVQADKDAPPIRWFAVQKSFGPLTLGRVGVLTSAERFGLALDASVATKALSIDLTGFIVSFDIKDISPRGVRVDLDGLGVAFTSGSVSLSGSLVGTGPRDDRSYDGSLLLQVGRFGVTAVGSYRVLNGYPSLFVFGMVQGQFGGPPAFFITGLAAGFGYNRGLRLPEPDQVQNFPLVLAARLGTSYLPDPTVKAALGKMSAGGWVPPEVGSYWVAAGVKFTSFQLIDSFLLLTVQFGNELVIALLGISSLQLPKPGWKGKPYAYVELVLSAVVRPAAGTVQVTALLTPNSFVIDKEGRLSGGFAFYLWFGELHRGDFVLTIGGYHDLYDKPAHYPVVPRLGISWTISPELHLAGSAYFALTPSCVMGGGRLDLAYQSGALRAWLRAHADFLMYWRPFFFDVSIGLVIGASYTLTIGSLRKTFSVELGAEVELWGPPLAGIARVSWWVISFTININGGGRPNLPGKVLDDWETFAASFLPPRPEICRPRADGGLAGMVAEEQRPDSPQIWLVSALDLVLASETVIPASVLVAGAPGTPQRTFEGTKPGVYPMGSLTMCTRHLLAVYRYPAGPDDGVDVSKWSWVPQQSGLPESLWGTVNDGDPDMDGRPVQGFTGLRGEPPPPAKTGPPAMPVTVFDHVAIPDGCLPLPAGDPINGATGKPANDPRMVIALTLMSPRVQRARAQIVAELDRLDLGRSLRSGDLSLLASQVRRTFPEPPMLGPPGTTGPGPDPAATAGRDRRDLQAGQRGQASQAGPARAAQTGGAPGRPGPSLTAVFRRNGEHAVAHVFDRFATRHDRAVLDSLGGLAASDGPAGPGRNSTFRLPPGTSLVWDLPPDAARLVEIPGDPAASLPVLLTAFDQQYRLVDWRTLAAGTGYPIPEQVRRLVIGCPAAESPAVGWSAATTLLQVGPQAMLAPGAVIRPQAPARIRCGRGSRPAGRIDGADLIAQNWAESAAGRRRGWVSTTLPAGVSSVLVTLAIDDASPPGGRADRPGGPEEPPADVWLLRDGRRIPLRPDPSRATRPGPGDPGPVRRLRCSVPQSAGADEPVCVMVAPRPGWYQHGLSADPDRGAPGSTAAGQASTSARQASTAGIAQVRLS